MNVVVDNLLVHYEIQGQGRVVLLLHGWGDSLKGLARLQRQLATQYQVVSLDLPGFGTTQSPAGDWDLDDYGKFLNAFLVKVAVAPYAVIGHSNGGALAIRAIALKLLQPEKLVLLAAAGIRSGNSGKRLLLKAVAKTGKAATVVLPKATRAKLRQKLYGAAGSDLLVVEHMQATFKKTVRQDVQADATELQLATLLLYASADTAIPLADGHKYHGLIKNSRLVIIDGAGHFLHLEQPARVYKAIEEFLA